MIIVHGHFQSVSLLHLQAPYAWRHAALDDVKRFLQSEVAAGRFAPQFNQGLFD